MSQCNAIDPRLSEQTQAMQASRSSIPRPTELFLICDQSRATKITVAKNVSVIAYGGYQPRVGGSSTFAFGHCDRVIAERLGKSPAIMTEHKESRWCFGGQSKKAWTSRLIELVDKKQPIFRTWGSVEGLKYPGTDNSGNIGLVRRIIDFFSPISPCILQNADLRVKWGRVLTPLRGPGSTRKRCLACQPY